MSVINDRGLGVLVKKQRLCSAVDTSGGLVVVCMTSFTSMLGVTSYVRLLNCYTVRRSYKSHFSSVLSFARLYDRTGKNDILNLLPKKSMCVTKLCLSIVILYVDTILAR